MPLIITLMIALMGSTSNVLLTAIDNYENVRSYQVTLLSEHGGTEQAIRYYYKKPGFVKMEFIRPHRGAVLVYDPYIKKVRVTPFRSIKFLHFYLDPDNNLIKSPAGHMIDKSDIGELLRSAGELQKTGTSEMPGEEEVNGKTAVRLNVKGEGNNTVDGIYKYELWLERNTLLPLKASSFDAEGRLIESVSMEDLEINMVFPDKFFDH